MLSFAKRFGFLIAGGTTLLMTVVVACVGDAPAPADGPDAASPTAEAGSTTVADGEQNGHCFPNFTCLGLLQCTNGLCLPPPGTGSDSGSSTDSDSSSPTDSGPADADADADDAGDGSGDAGQDVGAPDAAVGGG